jgi:hypothetical protein
MNKPRGLQIHIPNDKYVFWNECNIIAHDVEINLGV